MSVLILRAPASGGGGGFTPDYYIGPSGSDSNNGLTSGTPWAITALSSKASTYAGKNVGLMDGAYSSYNGFFEPISGNNDVAYYIPTAAAGSAGARTVIRAINRGAAVLDGLAGAGQNGSFPSQTATAICIGVLANYVTVDGLEVKKCWSKAVFTSAPNTIVQNCEVHDVHQSYNGAAGDGNNTCGIRTDSGGTAAYFGHNYIHDIRNGTRSHNECGIQLYNSTGGTVIECNEITDVTCAIYPKENSGSCVIRYNYIYTVADAFVYGTNDSFAFSLYNNVTEGISNLVFNDESNNPEVATTNVYNNTFIATVASAQAGWLSRAVSGSPTNFYNNLLQRSGGTFTGSYTDMNGSVSAFSTLDYNLYGASNSWTSPNGTTRTFAAWKSTTGKDASAVNSAATFAAGGTGPYAYKLNGGSATNAGKTGGTSGGSTVNIGAFSSSGQTEQIGPLWKRPA